MRKKSNNLDDTDCLINWGDVLLSEIENFRVHQGKVAVWFLSNCCFVIKTSNCILYTDPYFGGSFREAGIMRMTCLPLEPGLIKKANLVLCSHEHNDHCHRESLCSFYTNTRAIFIGPQSTIDLMLSWNFNESRIKKVKIGDKISCNDIDIYTTDSNDPESKGAVSYLFNTGKINLFFTGDSQYFDGFLKIGKEWDIDIAFINLGNNPPGKKYYMTPSDFLRTARELQAKIAVPMHWDIWTYSYMDPIILNDFQKYENLKVNILIMRLGDKIVYPY